MHKLTLIGEVAPAGAVFACVARSGAIILAERCPPGMVPLAVGGRARLELAVCRTSGRVRCGLGVVVPGMHVGLSDEAANLMVMEFQEALRERLEFATARDKCCGRASA